LKDSLLQVVAERKTLPSDRKQLQRVDWLQQALEIFVSEGINAVRITALSKSLGVTRGSFYWHFKNREELIDALVSYWKSKNTPALINSFGNAEDFSEGILKFFETCVDSTQFDSRLDLAIREWARRSDQIRNQIDQEDSKRIESMQNFFQRFKFRMPEALIRARVLYFTQIGFYALEVQEPLSTRLSYTGAYFECFTGRQLEPHKAERFQTHIQDTYGAEIP
jgi:AcrR family transcriptional regulator